MFITLKMFLPAMVMLILSANPCMGNRHCITINVRVQHSQRNFAKAVDFKKTITTASAFAENYNSLSSATSSSNSGEGSVSGEGYGVSAEASFGYSSAQSASIASVASSASSFSGSDHNEQSKERVFTPGFLQIFRKTSTQIVIDGASAKEVDEEIVNVVPKDQRKTQDQLFALDEQYVERRYDIKNNKGTYIATKCKDIAEKQPAGCYGGDSCCTPDNPCAEGEGDCDGNDDCQGDLMCTNGSQNCNIKQGNFDDTDDCCYARSSIIS